MIPLYCRRAVRVLTNSDTLGEELVRHVGVPRSKLRTVYAAADESFRPITDPAVLARVRERYRLPAEPFLLMVVKGHQILGQASGGAHPAKERRGGAGGLRPHAEAGRRGRRATAPPLVILGIGIAERLTPEAIAEHAEPSSVHTPGFVEFTDMPALYSMARALVFPSRYESFGIPIVEAMACGCPVVTATTSACPEVAGDAALLVDPDDVGGLAAAMERVSLDDGSPGSCGAGGCVRAAEFLLDPERAHAALRAAHGRGFGRGAVRAGQAGVRSPRSWSSVCPTLRPARHVLRAGRTSLRWSYFDARRELAGRSSPTTPTGRRREGPAPVPRRARLLRQPLRRVVGVRPSNGSPSAHRARGRHDRGLDVSREGGGDRPRGERHPVPAAVRQAPLRFPGRAAPRRRAAAVSDRVLGLCLLVRRRISYPARRRALRRPLPRRAPAHRRRARPLVGPRDPLPLRLPVPRDRAGHRLQYRGQPLRPVQHPASPADTPPVDEDARPRPQAPAAAATARCRPLAGTPDPLAAR